MEILYTKRTRYVESFSGVLLRSKFLLLIDLKPGLLPLFKVPIRVEEYNSSEQSYVLSIQSYRLKNKFYYCIKFFSLYPDVPLFY